MQKQIAMCLMTSMLMMVFGPAITAAETSTSTISTSFTAGISGSGNMTPVIKAVWETPDNYTTSEDTQIDPPLACDEQKTVTICSIFEDDALTDTMTPDEIAEVLNGKAWLYYDNRPGESDDYNLRVNDADDPIALSALTKDDGIALFCDDIGLRNPGITTYYDGYDYADICSSYGQLEKGTAFVFCGDYNLSYESAAGDYEVQVKATDSFGANVYTDRNSDWFTYVPWVAYEVDFSSIDYGNVARGAWDLDPDGSNIGDEIWGINSESKYRPTVRNVGNVELKMQVEQDNMASNGIDFDDIHYKARVGSQAPSWVEYEPYELATLDETLPLSTMLEMDFGIYVGDFIQGTEVYGGDMTLDAIEDPFEYGEPSSIHLDYTCPCDNG